MWEKIEIAKEEIANFYEIPIHKLNKQTPDYTYERAVLASILLYVWGLSGVEVMLYLGISRRTLQVYINQIEKIKNNEIREVTGKIIERTSDKYGKGDSEEA
jgi:hypothetical protein